MYKRPIDKIASAMKYVYLGFIIFCIFFPFVFMLFNSFKSEGAFVANKWLPTFLDVRFDNYVLAWKSVSPYLFNSIYLAIVCALGTLVVSSITAYIFAIYDFPFKRILFLFILMILMIPGILTFIPQVIIVKNLGIYNSHWAIILPSIASGQIFCTFVLKSFFESLPSELTEAAKIDGARDGKIIFSIIIPLSFPMFVTLGVLQILASWNSYLWPLTVLTRKAQWTIPIGIKFLSEQGSVKTTVQYAAYTIVSIPLILLFAFTMDKFVEGLSTGAIKA